ncbi:MAG TPA: methylamine methyltransferase corrinoid protein reductive activase [Methanomicrobia archaeon]|nr:methylamine methyltransferase corrinoid protein reductive activase [Methanomicrobia archaeon]
MTEGIAIDLGTSGFRAQRIDLGSGAIVRTAITLRNPLPGANVMDHLHFAVTWGQDTAHDLVVQALMTLFNTLGATPGSIDRIAICGNPIQLSLFQGIPIDDLAYAGDKKKEKYHIADQDRSAAVRDAGEIAGMGAFEGCELRVPPAVKHEVGADALALLVKSGMLDSPEISIATDYGTNAEMALKVDDIIYTGSAAAGPALEGQEVACGTLAKPRVVSDIDFEDGAFRSTVLSDDMDECTGALFNPINGEIYEEGTIAATGITGTGVIALIKEGMETELVKLPHIKTRHKALLLHDDLYFDEHDLVEAGRAIGAIRAGHVTLCDAAGIDVKDIETAYMSGAAGTYMDAAKAHMVGLVPYAVRDVYQIGNTSLALARDVLLSEDRLWELEDVARSVRGSHVMFATSPAFKKAYINELSYWEEGMPFERMQTMLKRRGLPMVAAPTTDPKVHRIVVKDIPDLGTEGLRVLERTGTLLTMKIEECTLCGLCEEVCTHDAIELHEDGTVVIRSDLCDGSHCQKCIHACHEELLCWECLEVVER